MNVRPKELTYSQAESSPEIQNWLASFDEDRAVAIETLLRLRFISRDDFSEWLKQAILSGAPGKTALFAVRKLTNSLRPAWDSKGDFEDRPSYSLGSEDLVQSVIANLAKDNQEKLFDHPGIALLRAERIANVVLLDDSIGTGERVESFIQSMFMDRHFLSWWSYGKIRIVVIAFARTREAEERIRSGLPGSNHGVRKYPSASKIRFVSHFAYERDNLPQRWGENYQRIVDFCDQQKNVPSFFRRGFGGSMSNTVFYHSVPDNLPGCLWFQDSSSNALFPVQPTFWGDGLKKRTS